MSSTFSCKKSETYFNALHPGSKDKFTTSITVPFNEASVDSTNLLPEVKKNLKEYIRKSPLIQQQSTKRIALKSNIAADSGLTLVIPQPTITIPQFTEAISSLTDNLNESEELEWTVATLDWFGTNIAKVLASEVVEYSGRIATNEFDHAPDSVDIIVYNIDRAQTGGSYSDTPMLLGWEEKSHFSTLTNSEIQGTAKFTVKGYAKKVGTILEEYVNNSLFWSTPIRYIPIQK
ncbi:MAG: hypothetical protein LBF27_05540 [Sphingobacterium sp.]|nr:hypothetical protein [Sphingobacterium sp.]